ncbi:DUF1566 domain-containing protein [Thermodesulfobacteriota bacterium]
MKELFFVILILSAVLMIVPPAATAGNIDGPGEEPGSTMVTMQEIFDAATPLPTGFVLWPANNRFAVWDNATESTSDDVVLDRSSGLMWPRNCHLFAGGYNYDEAVANINDLVFGNRMDWRTPTMAELAGILPMPERGTLFVEWNNAGFTSCIAVPDDYSKIYIMFIQDWYPPIWAPYAGSKSENRTIWPVRGGY